MRTKITGLLLFSAGVVGSIFGSMEEYQIATWFFLSMVGVAALVIGGVALVLLEFDDQ